MRRYVLGVVVGLALAACVDGTTPDCSDAASQCGPSLDGTIGEASVEDGSADGAADGANDAPTDVGTDTAPHVDAGTDAADAADAKG